MLAFEAKITLDSLPECAERSSGFLLEILPRCDQKLSQSKLILSNPIEVWSLLLALQPEWRLFFFSYWEYFLISGSHEYFSDWKLIVFQIYRPTPNFQFFFKRYIWQRMIFFIKKKNNFFFPGFHWLQRRKCTIMTAIPGFLKKWI